MDNDGNAAEPTVESITSEINTLRADPAYHDEFRRGTIEQKNLHAKVKGLYAQKRELAGTDTNGNVQHTRSADRPPVSLDPQHAGDLTQQTADEIGRLEELGVDVGEEVEVNQHNLDAYRQLRLIEECDFAAVAPMLSKAAVQVGLPIKDISMIRKFVPLIKDPDAKGIVREIASYIYRKRNQRS